VFAGKKKKEVPKKEISRQNFFAMHIQKIKQSN